jgi:hypothetical protein
LSRWFTAEWAEYLSAEENLPPIGGALSPADRVGLRQQLCEIFAPLTDFEERFRRTPMDPQAASRLLPFATVLKRYAVLMVGLCGGTVTPAKALEDLAALEKHLHRLPASLASYTRTVVQNELIG